MPRKKTERPLTTKEKEQATQTLIGVCMHNIMMLDRRVKYLESTISKMTENVDEPEGIYV